VLAKIVLPFLEEPSEGNIYMSKVIVGTTMSLDGFVANRNGDELVLYPDLEAFTKTAMFQQQILTTGAAVMGRHTYDRAQGDMTGYEFQIPIFVLTHQPPKQGPKGQNDKLKVTFVTDGIESVLEKAKAAAGNKDVLIIGGANVSQQCIKEGLADELSIGIAPLLLGEGLRFFEHLDAEDLKLERIGTAEAAGATYIRYRVLKRAD
jgi:dihydrofolate reductase